MAARIRATGPFAVKLSELEQGLVFVAAEIGDDWEDVLAELTDAFTATREALLAEEPVVYVVRNDDLLGRGGAGRAMAAVGLVSAARTAALEARKTGTPVNVLAIENDTPPDAVASWCRRMMEAEGPTGELVHLGGGQLGKAPT